MFNEDPTVVKKVLDKSKSLYDQSRDTVGKIYRDTKMNADGVPVLIGDLSNEMVPGLVDDINKQLSILDPHYLKLGIPYYLIMVEKRDLQMPDRMDRLFSHKPFRPWPEANTTVFKKDPKIQHLWMCWSLPHRAEMMAIMMEPNGWDEKQLALYKAWEEYNLKPFGFYYHAKEKWIPNPKWEDELIDPKPA